MVRSRRTVPLEPGRLLAGCDADQVEAITSSASPLCVLAAAGSGKTRVLTRRVAWRVLDGSAVARYVLVLTFTRKASLELRERLVHLGLPEQVQAGTFHAVALGELRRLAAERGRPAPVVLASKARLLAAATETAGRVDRERLAALASEIEWARARLLTPRSYPAALSSLGRQAPLPVERFAAWWSAYEREKKRRGVLDFDDLLSRCATELEEDPDFAAAARWRFRHFFVDEYQDVNAAQLRLIDLWLGDRTDLCVVGDPDQAIYSWNGSDPRALEEFPRRHRGATVLRLRVNYRSSSGVLAVAASVIEGAPSPGGTREGGPTPTMTAYDSDDDEAAGVARAVRACRRAGLDWSKIAVLARTNAQLSAFERALQGLDVPCRSGGGRSFLARPAVRAALGELGRTDAPGLRAWREGLGDQLSRAPSGEPEAPPKNERTSTSRAAPELQELVVLADDYLAEEPTGNAEAFSAWLEASLRSDPPPGSPDAVELMTFHRAKGLEWPVVFVTGLEEGLVPIAHARDKPSKDEERRLLYVACTRARDELHCSWARTRTFPGGRSARTASPYVAAIDAARSELARLELSERRLAPGGSPPQLRELLATRPSGDGDRAGDGHPG